MIRRVVLCGLLLGSGCAPYGAAKPTAFAEAEPMPIELRLPAHSAPPVDEQAPPPGDDLPRGVDPSTLPAFVDLDRDPKALFPLRAKVVVAGPVYESHDASPNHPGDGHSVLVPVLVIDGDYDGAPRRPRLLCEENSHRVAVHRDATDFATVALAGALIVASSKIPSRPTDETVGVHVGAGAELELQSEPTNGARRVGYDGLFLSAEGWMDASLMDIVYAPVVLEDDGVRNGELLRSVSVREAPGGRELAKIEKDPTLANVLYVRTLASPQAGHVLIRYQELDGYVVGWVAARAIRTLPEKVFGRGLGGGGSGEGRLNPRVKLSRGTLLTGRTSGAVLGVVTADASYHCLADCAAATPVVSVAACGGSIALRVLR